METFDQDKPCPKCGAVDLHHRYRQKGERLDPDPLYFTLADCNLIRTYCRTCGHRWGSLPVDSTLPAPDNADWQALNAMVAK